jgi:hypothetical protein
VHPKRFLSLWYAWHKPCTYLTPTLTPCPNRPTQDSTRRASRRSSIRCVRSYLQAHGMFGANRAPILRQDWHYLQIERNELPLEPRVLGVPSGASKMIPKPMVCLAQTMHLSCSDNNTVSIQTEMRFDMTQVT